MRFPSFCHKVLSRAALAAIGLALTSASHAQEQQTFKIGVIGFFSGPAAESYGVPTSNATKMLVEAFNNGSAPAPYATKGFGGMKIEYVLLDENGGATKQVQELRNLYQREGVDAIVGYNGSGDCLAVAPVAEEMKKLLVMADCGTPRIFEEANYKYVFRTSAHGIADNVALARYLKSRNIKADRINLINPDYSYGQDARADFLASMTKLYPGHKVQADLLPKFNAGQYGSEISTLALESADIVYSSLWGGDLQAFLLQASPRGLFKKTPLVLPAADHAFNSMGAKFPNGVIFGARGSYGLLAQPSPLNDWFVKTYEATFGKGVVSQGSYRTAQALMGLKQAVEKAMTKNGGKKPQPEEVADALRGSEWDSPGGKIRMTLADGHQAVQSMAIGRTRYDATKKSVVAEDIQQFAPECVMPPAGMKSQDWIKAGFPGARCN